MRQAERRCVPHEDTVPGEQFGAELGGADSRLEVHEAEDRVTWMDA